MKKHPNLRGLASLAAFLLGFALLIAFANLHFIETDTITRMTLYEMQQRDDIDMAIVGSSIVRDHFNTELIRQETGLNAFCATVPTASMPASIALTKELYRTNSPEWVVLVTEPYNFQTVREPSEAFYKLAPFLSDPANALEYYLRTSLADGHYVERLLLMRGIGAKSLQDVARTIALRYFPEKAFERIRQDLDPTISYQGSGFLRYETDERADDEIRKLVRQYTGYYYELFDESKAQLLEYKQLCEANGSNLLIVVYPNHTAQMLSTPDFLDYTDSLVAFCREQNIPCFNFSYAKPELMENLDGYFFDPYHMVGEGADILSETFARVFNMHVAGEDVSPLFYRADWEYVDAIDFITNAWVARYDPLAEWDYAFTHDEARIAALAASQDVFLAECNRGFFVVPEYRFVLRNDDGTETLLQDYGVDTLYACAPGALDGRTLRVYARIAQKEDAPQHWYDLLVE